MANTSLPLFTAPESILHNNGGQSPSSQVQDYIDTTTIAALEGLLSPNGHPSVTIKRRPRKALFFINPGNGALETNETDTSMTYAWPGKDAYEAWKFSTEPAMHSAPIH